MADQTLNEEIQDNKINILLLGESGVGKSTFINSTYNYFNYLTIEHVLKNKLEVLIPAKFEITDENFEQQTVILGNITDQNECFEDGAAATQSVKMYDFSIEIYDKVYKLTLVDTPGIADQRGADQDKINCEHILDSIAGLKKIHGICLLLNPNNPRLDFLMQYCITQLFSRLEFSAANNILFVFTSSRGENYTPGRTSSPLKVLVEKFRKANNVIIPFGRENIFCLDNESFRYVGAVQNGVKMAEGIYETTKSSWEKSSKELWRMMEYVTNIKPHDLAKTMLIHEAKLLSSLLIKPLFEVLNAIQHNVQSIEKTTNLLNDENLTLEKLKNEMIRKRVHIKIIPTKKRQTVCNDKDCIGNIEIDGIRQTHYKKRCCRDCNGPLWMCRIFGNLPGSFHYVLTSELFVDQKKKKLLCSQCNHEYNAHEQIYYTTELVTSHDKSVLPKVKDQTTLVTAKNNYLKELSIERQEYEQERYLILHTCAVIECFLKENSITATNGITEKYLHYGMVCGNDQTNEKVDKSFFEYHTLKNELKNINVENKPIDPDVIKEAKVKLFKMKHFGTDIEEIFKLKEEGTKEDMKGMRVQVTTNCIKKCKEY